MLKNITFALVAATATIAASGTCLAQISDNKIKVGVLTDLSGTYSDISGTGSVIAAQLAIEDFGGKVKGVPIELASADHLNKADQGSSIARRWYDAEQVDAIFDISSSAVALAVREISRERNKIDMVSGAGTTALTNKACSATGFHWTYDTYAMATGTARAVVKNGGTSWFFLTADYAFGHALERDTSSAILEVGGTIKGSIRHPFPGSDFSSFLLQAQSSGAKVIGLANAGQDTLNAIRQAKEFGLTEGGQQLAAMLLFLSDIHSLGLDAAQDITLTTGFYWDHNEKTRDWSKRFMAKTGRMPTMVQAGVYSAVSTYLAAVQSLGVDDGIKVAQHIRGMTINDAFASGGKVRADGRMVHDMYLVQVKKPKESKAAWDYYKLINVIPGDTAFMPLSKSECALVAK